MSTGGASISTRRCWALTDVDDAQTLRGGAVPRLQIPAEGKYLITVHPGMPLTCLKRGVTRCIDAHRSEAHAALQRHCRRVRGAAASPLIAQCLHSYEAFLEFLTDADDVKTPREALTSAQAKVSI